MSHWIRILLVMLLAAEIAPAFAQKALPNPLVQPPRRGWGAGDLPAPGPDQQGTVPAPGRREGEKDKDADGVPADLISRVGNLYVSAIIGDVAILRSQAGAVQGGAVQGGGTAAGGPGGGIGGSGSSGGAAGAAGARSIAFYVRDAEPIQMFDRFRLLPRVQDTTVVLYLLPDNPAEQTKRPQVVFRSSLDSLNSTPYVPPRLEAGKDGDSYQSLIQTGAGSSGGGAAKSGGAAAAGAK